MKVATTLAFAALTVLYAGSANAQFAKAEDAIKYRKNALFVMQQHFARVGAMVAGKAPFDAKAAADNAAVAEYMAKLPWAGFGPGTETGDTKARPEIWREHARFDELAQKMQAEMGKLVAATKTGNLDAIKPAFQAAGNSCKACHDDFRAK